MARVGEQFDAERVDCSDSDTQSRLLSGGSDEHFGVVDHRQDERDTVGEHRADQVRGDVVVCICAVERCDYDVGVEDAAVQARSSRRDSPDSRARTGRRTHAECGVHVAIGAADDDCVAAVGLDAYLVARFEAGDGEGLDRERYLVLAGDPGHAFTIS